MSPFVEIIVIKSYAGLHHNDATLAGQGGSILTFNTFLIDTHNDAMGYMRLTVPTAWIKKGEPVTLRLVGDADDSPTWVYIHGPSHQHALAVSREAGILLPAAEKFASVNALLEGSWEQYPQDTFLRAWRAAIYPDHGWGGKNGDITDQIFLEILSQARDLGDQILKRLPGASLRRCM